MAIEYIVCCDECSTVIDGSGISARHARLRAVKEGTLVRYAKKDYCMSCARFLGIAQDSKEIIRENQQNHPQGANH